MIQDTYTSRVVVWNETRCCLQTQTDDTHHVLYETITNLKWPKGKNGWDSLTINKEDQSVRFLIVAEDDPNLIYQDLRHRWESKWQNKPETNPSSEWIKIRVQLLLSNLQKAVRLRQIPTANKTLKLLLDEEVHQAKTIKRLFIIIAEDATLHPWIPLLLLLSITCAKGWKLTLIQKSILVSMLQETCQPDVPADWRCRFDSSKIPEGYYSSSQNSEHELFLDTIWWRASFGGMHGDMSLLRDLYVKWMERLTEINSAPTCFVRWSDPLYDPSREDWQLGQSVHVVLTQVGDDNEDNELEIKGDQQQEEIWKWLEFEDEIPAAVDMHCTSIIPYLIERFKIKTNEYTKLSSLIWDRRSSLRKRVCTCGEHPDDETLEIKRPAIEAQSDPEWWSKVLIYLNAISITAWKFPKSLTPKCCVYTTSLMGGNVKSSREQILQQQLQSIAKSRGEMFIEKEVSKRRREKSGESMNEQSGLKRPRFENVF